MKHLVPSALVLMFALLLQPGIAQEWTTAKLSFADECEENIQKHMIPSDRLREIENDFVRFRSMPGPQAIEPITGEFNMKSLLEILYKEARENMLAAAQCKGKKCMTGITIRLGLVNHSIEPIYQSIYLIPGGGKGMFQPILNSKYYRYANNQFTEVDLTSAETSAKRYQDNVRIRHFRNSDSHTGMTHTTGWKGDTKSLVFTFQELAGYYHQIYTEEFTPEYYDQNLTVHNGCVFHDRNWFTRSRAKHTVFITKEGWNFAKDRDEKVLILTFEGGMDFAHLCPPSCNELEFELK